MCAYVVHHVDVCFLDEEYDLLLVRVHVEPCQFSQIARVNPRCHAMIRDGSREEFIIGIR